MEGKARIEIKAVGTDGSVILPGSKIKAIISTREKIDIEVHGVVSRLVDVSSIRFVDFTDGKEKIIPINRIKELINVSQSISTENVKMKEEQCIYEKN